MLTIRPILKYPTRLYHLIPFDGLTEKYLFRITRQIEFLSLQPSCATVSRLYPQVHFPADVIGGVLLAVICLTGCALLDTDLVFGEGARGP